MKKLTNKIKKCIKNPLLIALKLMNMGILNFLSDKKYIKLEYKIVMKKIYV